MCLADLQLFVLDETERLPEPKHACAREGYTNTRATPTKQRAGSISFKYTPTNVRVYLVVHMIFEERDTSVIVCTFGSISNACFSQALPGLPVQC